MPPNLGSPVEHWDHLLVGSMELKFSPETAREWNKSLGKSREFASYQDIYDFLTICTRSRLDTSDAADTKARAKSRPSVNRSLPALIVPVLTIWLRVKTFAQSRSHNVMRWLRRNKCVSIACGRITIHQNARADRDVFIVIASITRCYISKSRPYRRPSIQEESSNEEVVFALPSVSTLYLLRS